MLYFRRNMLKTRLDRIIQALVCFAIVMVMFNIVYHPSSHKQSKIANHLRGFENILKDRDDSSSSTKQQKDTIKTHLILVAGHAVVKIDQLDQALTSDSAWYLLDYQLKQDFPLIIAGHIRKGLSLLASDVNATLVFSGGQTRRDVGPLSEAASYYYVANENKWITVNNANHIYLEEFSRDSYENLLFSICRFKEIHQVYPTQISVVGFDFKMQRFIDFHRSAIRFPKEQFHYIGLHPPGILFDHHKAMLGEVETINQFRNDVYACNTDLLKIKRQKRNPFLRTIPYQLSCPELKPLLNWCGPEIFTGSLPWS